MCCVFTKNEPRGIPSRLIFQSEYLLSSWILKVLYYNLLTSGKLHSLLADTEEQAQQLFSRLIKQYSEKEVVIKQLKATDMLL